VASNDLRLAHYYSTLDDDGIADAVSLLHEDVRYVIVLPSGVNRGTSRQGIRDYLESRPPVQRRHHLLRTARDGDTEFVYGAVTDNGNVTGRFAAVAHVDADGMIDAYQVTFDLELVVVPSGELA
jgi:ketosteroid isomerase-like protein